MVISPKYSKVIYPNCLGHTNINFSIFKVRINNKISLYIQVTKLNKIL